MSRQNTIREGTSEKHWYLPVGYIALAILIGATMVYASVQTGSAAAAGAGAAIFLFVLSAGGLITYPALFKDAAYLRGTSNWQVKWWRYIGGGLLTPVVVYGALMGVEVSNAGTLAIFSHGATALIANAHYLYRRHQIVGVP